MPNRIGTQFLFLSTQYTQIVSAMGTLKRQPIFFVLVLTYTVAMGREPSATTVAPADDRTIAVVDLVDKGPSVKLAVLRTAFAEMLSGDLSQYEGIRVVERVRVDHFLRETHLEKGFTDAAAANRAGQALAAEYLLTGSFRGDDKTVTLGVSLFEVGKEEPLLRWKRSGPVEKLVDLEQELAGKVLVALGIADGERFFYQGHHGQSVRAFERVLLVEPKNAHAAVKRVQAWRYQMEYDKAIGTLRSDYRGSQGES